MSADLKIKGTNVKKKAPDLATLRPPVLTTTTGMRQAIHVLETGSREVKEALLHESNLIYECKVCFSMFRSVANLVAHKRSFCQVKSKSVLHVHRDDSESPLATTVIVEPEAPEHMPSTWNMDNYSPTMELLQTAGVLEDMSSKVPVNPNKSLLAVSQHLRLLAHERSMFTNFRSRVEEKESIPQETLVLEPVHNSSQAHYQTFKLSSSELTVKDLNEDINTSKFERDNLNIIVRQSDDTKSDVAVTESYSKNNSGGKNGEKRISCPKCANDYGCFFSLQRHLKKRHEYTNELWKEIRNSLTNRSSQIKSTVPEPVRPVANPVKSFVVNLERLKLSEEQQERLQAYKSSLATDEPDPPLPKHVENKIMEQVNRRHVQCKICYKKFRSTALVKQHVAGTHLNWKRFKCTVCGFGAWARSHVMKHTQHAHRKYNKDMVKEQDVAEYYILPSPSPKKVEKSISPLKKVDIRISPIKMMQYSLVNHDDKEKSPSTFSEKENEPDLPCSRRSSHELLRLSVEEEKGVIRDLVGKVVPKERPTKRRRLDSGGSCSNSSDTFIHEIANGESSPKILMDTRDKNTRLLSPTRSKEDRRSARAAGKKAKLFREENTSDARRSSK